MTGANGSPQGDCVRMDARHEPLRGVAPDGSGWLALDDDPQFLLSLPGAQPAAVYRITAQFSASPGATPRVYFDDGAGWTADNCVVLTPQPGGRQWSCLVVLKGFGDSLRFDPLDHPGRFTFDGLSLERWSHDEAVLLALDRAVAAKPGHAASLVHQTVMSVLGEGAGRALPVLLSLSHESASTHEPTGYLEWIDRYDTLGPREQHALVREVAKLGQRPLVSIILPLNTADAPALAAAVDAVMAQLYPDWELILCTGREPSDALAPSIAAFSSRSSRIRVVRPEGDHACRPPYEAGAAAARGDWLLLIDASVRLAPHALLAAIAAAVEMPEACVIYADDDLMDRQGRRHDPRFKPRWDPELLLSQDYLTPMVLYRTDHVDSVGGVRARGTATRFDLAVRCTSAISEEQIVHVSHVLCHVANDGSAAEFDRDACMAVVRQHLADHGVAAGVMASGDGWRVVRHLPSPRPKVSLIIPTRDRVDLLRRCVDSILERTTYEHYEIVIVDNQSSDPEALAYLQAVAVDPRVRVIAFDAPFNYSKINNAAVDQADSAVVGLLNNDVEVITPDWLEEMVQYALMPGVGAVGAMLYYPDDTIQHAGVVIGLGGVAGHAHVHRPRGYPGPRGRLRHVQRQSAVTAACLLVRREAYVGIGGLDEALAVAFNDVDFCLRLSAAGLHNVWTPFAELYHHESASRGIEDTREKQDRFAAEVGIMLARWPHALAADPAYHPALSLRPDSAFEPADPPRVTLDDWAAQSLRGQSRSSANG